MLTQDREWAKEIAKKIKEKELVVANRSQGIIPYTTENGRFDDQTGKNICWWTNGFWGGMMWQLYHATQEEIYKINALDNESKLDRNLMNYSGMDHDSGFKWLLTSVADYQLTKNPESKNRAMLAADNLAGRYNPVGKFIRAWNDDGDGSKAGWAIIDCMMNLPLLYWAYGETKDPKYLHIATGHADTAMKYFVRENGSVNHIVEFNPMTGEFVKTYGGQGYGEGSTWTRGEAWAVYGFTLSYLHTKDAKYLETAKKCAAYFIAHIPESGFIPIDFDQPADCPLEDSLGAVIAACGLLELSKLDENPEENQYQKAAMKLLKTIAEKRCNFDLDCDHLVEKCSAAFHRDAHEYAIIYGDYYFIEAIWKLTGEELFLW